MIARIHIERTMNDGKKEFERNHPMDNEWLMVQDKTIHSDQNNFRNSVTVLKN